LRIPARLCDRLSGSWQRGRAERRKDDRRTGIRIHGARFHPLILGRRCPERPSILNDAERIRETGAREDASAARCHAEIDELPNDRQTVRVFDSHHEGIGQLRPDHALLLVTRDNIEGSGYPRVVGLCRGVFAGEEQHHAH
jgi:hypothetical protein